jgi:hypothetical protein
MIGIIKYLIFYLIWYFVCPPKTHVISNQFSLKYDPPPPPLLGELFCGGKNKKVKNDHKSFLREN